MNLFLISLGCAKNMVDSEMIVGLLEKNNIKLIDNPEEADILMVNTCAFIESARKEAIDTILDLASYKNENKKLIVCGCFPQRYKEELIKLFPEVDLFIRIDEYQNISQIITNLFKSDFKLSGNLTPLTKHISTPNYMRYVKISEGCLNRCAFCAIPLIRGKLKSREISDIVSEVELAVKEGTYEINLISQDTTRYGYDLYKENSIVKLLDAVCQIEGNFRVRLLYLYPDIVSDELIDFIKNNDKVIPYFDVPIQHSEDHLLKRMNRRGYKDYLLDLFKKIKREIPHAILRTTIIVGFPGETDEDIKNLLEFMDEVKFDHLGAFTFSPEEGTKALEYDDVVSEDDKNRRYNLVMSKQKDISLAHMESYLNKELEVFITGYDEESYFYLARNDIFASDDIDGVIYVAAKDEHNFGDVIKIKVLDCDAYTLTGEEI